MLNVGSWVPWVELREVPLFLSLSEVGIRPLNLVSTSSLPLYPSSPDSLPFFSLSMDTLG
jgi:hypothetical protein